MSLNRRLALVCGVALAAGCGGSPNKVNIELRKKNQQLVSRVEDLNRRHEANVASIRGLQAGATTVPVLPEEELEQLFTVAGLKFGGLTGGYHPDPNQTGDTMLKVYVAPTDGQGDVIKAAGSFHVDLFDPSLKSGNRIGSWDFDLQKAKSAWNGHGLLYTYVLDCPWQTAPVNPKLTARITFTDALTHRVISVDRDVMVELPG